MAVWPVSLTITKDNFSEEPPDRVLRTGMDKGPDKLRRRTTANIRPVTISLFLDDTGVDTLDDFYLANDVERFDFEHPRTGDTVEARFVEPPKYTIDETMWRVTVRLEILP